MSATPPPALTRKALVGTGWSSLSTTLRQLLSLAAIPLLGRLLGPAAYGLMGMSALVTNFLVNFRDLGTAAAVIQRKSTPHRFLSGIFWVNFTFGLVLFLIVFASAYPAAQFFHEPQLLLILRVLSVSFWITSMSAVHIALLTREMEFRRLAWIEVGSTLGGYLVAVPCAVAGWGVWSLVYANLVNSILTAGLSWVFCKWRPSLQFNVTEMRSIAGFSLNLSGFGLVNYFARNADNLVVGHFLGSLALGYYQMAYNLMLYPIQNVSSMIGQVLLTAFSTIQDDNERFRRAYTRACMLIGLITFPLLAGLAVVADPFVRGVLGPKWVPMITVFQILAPIGMLQSIQTTVGHIYISKARTDWMFRWVLFAAPLVVTSFMIGVRWGIIGVAIGYAIASLILLYPGFAIPFRLIGLRFSEFTVRLLPQLGITLWMAAGCVAWLASLRPLGLHNIWIQLISTVLLGILLYTLMMWRLRPAVIDELEDVLRHSPSSLVQRVLRLLRYGNDRAGGPGSRNGNHG